MSVQRLFSEGIRVGFCVKAILGELQPLDGEYSNSTSGLFLYKGMQYQDVLNATIQAAIPLCAKPECKLVLLDEVGGLELANSTFMAALNEILALGKPCLGVVKSRRNLDNMLSNLVDAPPQNEIDALYQAHKRLIETITANGELLTMDVTNAAALRAKLTAFVEFSIA